MISNQVPVECSQGLLVICHDSLPWDVCRHVNSQSSELNGYRIYSINRPGRLLNFWTLRVGSYQKWVLIRGWALIKFSPFSVSVVCLFCNETVNGKSFVFGDVSYQQLFTVFVFGVGEGRGQGGGGVGAYLSLIGREKGWALIRGWALINFFSAFWMGAYSRPELIRCWALI